MNDTVSVPGDDKLMRNWRTWFKEQIVALFGVAMLAFTQAAQKKKENSSIRTTGLRAHI
jgi:hypothetical protein